MPYPIASLIRQPAPVITAVLLAGVAWGIPPGASGVITAQTRSADATTAFSATSRDGARRYQVRVVRPPQPPPAAGYPVLYLLDGQSTLAAITPEMRATAWAAIPTVFVAIAHETDDRAALVAARTLDFTVGPRGADLRPSDPPSGGADAFLDLLVDEIRPGVERLAPIDASRQALYGHSYGAVFVLHTLFTRPSTFQTFIAASPSLWWGDGYLERAVTDAASTLRTARARVLLTIGDQEERRPRGTRPEPGAGARNVAALQTIARQLDAHASIDATWRVYEGRNHGAAMPPSVADAVALVTGHEVSSAP